MMAMVVGRAVVSMSKVYLPVDHASCNETETWRKDNAGLNVSITFQEIFMRSFLATSAIALGLTACASQTPAPAQPVAATKPAAVAKVPQCFNGDTGKFEAVGTVSTISGLKVACEKTSDGKNAQWMSAKK
jgi:hypothetical protein